MANAPASSLPDSECDLVMKGGITSGIVYPPALRELSQKYRFRQVGGTSAGAIAAACAAAAEYGRESDKPGAGFAGLGAVSDWLGQGTNLRDLFQASPMTRPLFKTFIALTGNKPSKKPGPVFSILRAVFSLTVALIRYESIRFLVGAAIGGVIAIVLRWLTLNGSGAALMIPTGGVPLLFAALGLLGFAWLGGFIASTIGLVKIVLKEIPQNLFGICTGSAEPADQNAVPVLTDWLHETIQKLAGLDPKGEPLTFGMFKAKEQSITLNMVTTNLSDGQPYKLPFEKKPWIFKEQQMQQLFPSKVVEHLIKHAGNSDKANIDALPGYHFLPNTDDLPVTVAMRMSLSFPVLICAVPLWDVPGTAYRQRSVDGVAVLKDAVTDLEQHWFSDGGISSNFPIHFFDAWLPHRPTFGINLRSMPPKKASEHAKNLAAAVKSELASKGEPPRPTMVSEIDGQVFLLAADAPQHPEVQPLPGLADFLGAIWNTAQNYHDNMQALLPSYRERIANIRMGDDEGGLNLTMDPAVVKKVQDKGATAGRMLREHFDMGDHRWVRFQVLMSQLEQDMELAAERLAELDYEQMLKELAPETATSPLPYPRPPGWRTEADKRVNAIRETMSRWKELNDQYLAQHPEFGNDCFFPFQSPKPDPVLRVAPDL